MEKLIELHKKFIVEMKDYSLIYYNVEFKEFCFDCVDSFYDFSEGVAEYLCSKQYGFIEWLVENEKIDYNKDKYGMVFFENGVQVFLSGADEVIMELSIQDDPIDFLISILK